jgi:hypothetical protein
MAAILLRRKQGAVIALTLAMLVDFLSEASFVFTQYLDSTYVFYATLFLICFGWWIIMCKLKMISSQIVTGIACVFMSISVVDCYFADGYATFISMAFPFVILILNAATIWAAWNDRNWTYSAYCNNWGESVNKNNEVDIRC